MAFKTSNTIRYTDYAYKNIYDELYNYNEYEDYDYDKALDAGDEILADENYKDIIARLVDERGDYFSSDREIAALAIYLDEQGFGGSHTKDIKKQLNVPIPWYTDRAIKEIIEEHKHFGWHIYYLPEDRLLDTDTRRHAYDDFYCIDITLKNEGLPLTVENVRNAADYIDGWAEEYENDLKAEEEEKEYDPMDDEYDRYVAEKKGWN